MSARASRRLVGLAAAALAAGALAGCSQAAALAPVGGNRMTEVRYATIDVLLDHDVAIATAPVCERASDGAVSCHGTTAAGEDIASAAPAGTTVNLTVRVGAQTLYDGPMWTVLDRAAERRS